MNLPLRRTDFLLAALLVAAAFAAYGPALGSGFLAYDDVETILGNADVKNTSPAGLGRKTQDEPPVFPPVRQAGQTVDDHAALDGQHDGDLAGRYAGRRGQGDVGPVEEHAAEGRGGIGGDRADRRGRRAPGVGRRGRRQRENHAACPRARSNGGTSSLPPGARLAVPVGPCPYSTPPPRPEERARPTPPDGESPR